MKGFFAGAVLQTLHSMLYWRLEILTDMSKEQQQPNPLLEGIQHTLASMKPFIQRLQNYRGWQPNVPKKLINKFKHTITDGIKLLDDYLEDPINCSSDVEFTEKLTDFNESLKTQIFTLKDEVASEDEGKNVCLIFFVLIIVMVLAMTAVDQFLVDESSSSSRYGLGLPDPKVFARDNSFLSRVRILVVLIFKEIVRSFSYYLVLFLNSTSIPTVLIVARDEYRRRGFSYGGLLKMFYAICCGVYFLYRCFLLFSSVNCEC